MELWGKSWEKVSTKLHFKYGWTWKNYNNKAEMKERQKTTLHLLCNFGKLQ